MYDTTMSQDLSEKKNYDHPFCRVHIVGGIAPKFLAENIENFLKGENNEKSL